MFDLLIKERPSPASGYVELFGRIEILPGEFAGDDLSKFAIIPFVWQFGPVQHDRQGHGWRPAGTKLLYDVDTPDERQSTWSVVDAVEGTQHAAIVVARVDVPQRYFPTPNTATIHTMHHGPGTLPVKNLRGGPFFTVSPRRVHIETTPDNHLTGAVFGVPRAAWDDRWPDSDVRVDPKDCFRVVAWARAEDGSTLFAGERRCEVSGYWTFGDLDESQRNAKNYYVAWVEEDYIARPLDIPQTTGDGVISIAERPHQPPHHQGASSSLS